MLGLRIKINQMCLANDKNSIHIDFKFFEKYCDLTNSIAFKIDNRTTIFKGILQKSEKNYKISGFFKVFNPLKISV